MVPGSSGGCRDSAAHLCFRPLSLQRAHAGRHPTGLSVLFLQLLSGALGTAGLEVRESAMPGELGSCSKAWIAFADGWRASAPVWRLQLGPRRRRDVAEVCRCYAVIQDGGASGLLQVISVVR